MTSRRSPRRPISPVLVALFVGATTAGAATVLAEPPDALAGGSPGPVGSFNVAERPPVIGEAAARARPPAAPATSTTAPAPTTTAPVTTTEKPPPPSTSSEPAPPPNPPPPTAPDDSQQQANRVVELVNLARAEEGCAPLTVDERLVAAALAHSTDMAQRSYFEHTTPEGVKFDQRIVTAGYQAPGAENIARGQPSAELVMEAWMDSAGHRANILDCDLATIGVALVKPGFYWTQDFGYPLSPA